MGMELLGRQNIEIDFREYIPEGIPCLEASSASTAEYNSYLCIIPGKVLADIYDKYGSQLLEGNVRSFLSTKVAVNKKIRETILNLRLFRSLRRRCGALCLLRRLQAYGGAPFIYRL